MTTHNYDGSDDGQTFNLGSSSLDPTIVNATSSNNIDPTININASLVSGSFTVHATAGAVVNLDEVVGVAGTFELDANGGTIDVSAAVGVLANTNATIEGGGTFIVGGSFLGLLNDTSITFGTDNTLTDTLIIDNNGSLLNLSISPEIIGFNGVHQVIQDKLMSGADVATYTIAQIAGLAQTVTFKDANGQTLGSLTFAPGTFTPAQQRSYAKSEGPLNLVTAPDGSLTTSMACYVAGTRILTSNGEVAVENLAIGDVLVTASGATRPVVWIGHRRIDVTRHPHPEAVQPIRISASAFGDNLPRRDLWLSPEHCVAIEDTLIPINVLVNGTSVTQVEMDSVEYWHVELDAHDVVLAEGLPAESYLDTGNRLSFVNGGAFIEAHPDFRPRVWTETCLPMAFGGDPVARVQAKLRDRLPKLGFSLTEDADAHILVDGVRIEPIRLSPWRVGFALPQNGREIVLRSKLFTPAHVLEGASDTRKLGLCIARLQFDGVDWPLDSDEACADGWQAAEMADGRVSHRWTSGPISLFPGTRFVLADFGGFGVYSARSRLSVDTALAA